jgi:choline-glycine betaine transporter
MDIESFFFISSAVIFILFIQRKAVAEFLFEKIDIYITTKQVTYILIFSLVLVFILGILLSDLKSKYGHISKGYDKLRPEQSAIEIKKVKEKPHRWFDINFDIFNF